MTIQVVTPLCGRHEVARIYFEGMKRLGLEVLCAGDSPSDKALAREYGHECMVKTYSSLGDKWNQLIRTALFFKWTHLFISGDDNVYSNEVLSLYGFQDLEGLEKLYMIHPVTKRAILVKQASPVVIGTGRMLSRAMVESMCDEEACRVFPSMDREIDHVQDLMFLEKGYMPRAVDVNKGVMCIDIKHTKNIWGFDNFAGENVQYDLVMDWMGEAERELIRELK